MSLPIPKTSDLNTQIISSLEGSLSQDIPLLPKAFARVLAWSLAGVMVILYRYCGFIFLQLFVAYASMEETTVNGKKIRPLVEWGRLVGVGDPYDATRAEFTVSLPVLNQTGSFAAGKKFVRAETGVSYDVVAAVALNASTVTLHLKASGDGEGKGGVGDIGNLQPGDIVSLAGADARVVTDAVVVAQLVTAADAEDPEHYRGRIFDKIQRRAQGGAYADYAEWALTVPGVVNAYPYAGERDDGSGPGQVDVYIEVDPDTSGDPDGYPTVPQKGEVLAAINLNGTTGKATRRPVGAAVNVLSITRQAFNVEVVGLQPATSELTASIASGVDEHLRTREPFIEGLSSLPREDRVTKATVSGIVDTIASAAGATVAAVNLKLGSFAINAYTLDHGQKAKSGAVTFV